MKRGIIALGLLASLSAYSQESYVPQEGEGIVYFLPKTKIAIDIIATKSIISREIFVFMPIAISD